MRKKLTGLIIAAGFMAANAVAGTETFTFAVDKNNGNNAMICPTSFNSKCESVNIKGLNSAGNISITDVIFNKGLIYLSDYANKKIYVVKPSFNAENPTLELKSTFQLVIKVKDNKSKTFKDVLIQPTSITIAKDLLPAANGQYQDVMYISDGQNVYADFIDNDTGAILTNLDNTAVLGRDWVKLATTKSTEEGNSFQFIDFVNRTLYTGGDYSLSQPFKKSIHNVIFSLNTQPVGDNSYWFEARKNPVTGKDETIFTRYDNNNSGAISDFVVAKDATGKVHPFYTAKGFIHRVDNTSDRVWSSENYEVNSLAFTPDNSLVLGKNGGFIICKTPFASLDGCDKTFENVLENFDVTSMAIFKAEVSYQPILLTAVRGGVYNSFTACSIENDLNSLNCNDKLAIAQMKASDNGQEINPGEISDIKVDRNGYTYLLDSTHAGIWMLKRLVKHDNLIEPSTYTFNKIPSGTPLSIGFIYKDNETYPIIAAKDGIMTSKVDLEHNNLKDLTQVDMNSSINRSYFRVLRLPQNYAEHIQVANDTVYFTGGSAPTFYRLKAFFGNGKVQLVLPTLSHDAIANGFGDAVGDTNVIGDKFYYSYDGKLNELKVTSDGSLVKSDYPGEEIHGGLWALTSYNGKLLAHNPLWGKILGCSNLNINNGLSSCPSLNQDDIWSLHRMDVALVYNQ